MQYDVTPTRPTRIRIPRWSIARGPPSSGRGGRGPAVYEHPPRHSVALAHSRARAQDVDVGAYVCRRTHAAQAGRNGAKFPDNPANLSQPNIGRWWILIPPTRRTTSHLHTDVRRPRATQAPRILFSIFAFTGEDEKCRVFSGPPSPSLRRGFPLHAEDADSPQMRVR